MLKTEPRLWLGNMLMPWDQAYLAKASGSLGVGPEILAEARDENMGLMFVL